MRPIGQSTGRLELWRLLSQYCPTKEFKYWQNTDHLTSFLTFARNISKTTKLVDKQHRLKWGNPLRSYKKKLNRNTGEKKALVLYSRLYLQENEGPGWPYWAGRVPVCACVLYLPLHNPQVIVLTVLSWLWACLHMHTIPASTQPTGHSVDVLSWLCACLHMRTIPASTQPRVHSVDRTELAVCLFAHAYLLGGPSPDPPITR